MHNNVFHIFCSIHGSVMGQYGMQILCKVLTVHPNIVSLDLGDCKLTDNCIILLTDLLPPNGAKRGKLKSRTLNSIRTSWFIYPSINNIKLNL